MSVKAVDAVLDHSESQNGDRLTLLVIADEADSYGVAWPSIARIATRSKLSERQVQRSIKDLSVLGELARRPKHPNGPWPVYRIVLPDLAPMIDNHPAWEGGDRLSPPTGDICDTEGRQMIHEGVTSATSTPLIDPTGPVNDPLPQAAHVDGKLFSSDIVPLTPKPERKRDYLFDALVGVCFISPSELTKRARGALNQALKELRDIGATPEQVHSRGNRFREIWPGVTLTPSALASQWATLAAAPTPTKLLGPRKPSLAELQHQARQDETRKEISR